MLALKFKMEEEYNFSLNMHSDLVLTIGKLDPNWEYSSSELPVFNLGYHHMLELPIVHWLYNLQIHKKNIFDKLDIKLGEKYDLDDRSERIVNEVSLLSHQLPLSNEDFNRELISIGVGWFHAGDNRTQYRWSVENDNLLLFKQNNNILSFSAGESE